MVFQALIERKRDGQELAPAEWRAIIAGLLAGTIPDYQMAALLMAVVWRGLSRSELDALTGAMLDSGQRLRFEGFATPRVDKHSTGGVGDKVSLVLAPLVASCGVAVPMMSGRGLGHTGGTVDKLESIPGFRTALTLAEAEAQTRKIGCVLAGPDRRGGPRRPAALCAPRRDWHGTLHSAHRRQHHVEEAGRGAHRAGARRQGR